MEKKRIKINNPDVLLDPAIIRAKKVEEESRKRIEEIAKEIIEVMKKHQVKVNEVTTILNVVDSKLGQSIGNKLVDEIYEEKEEVLRPNQ